jgi:hypothetical protein
MRNPWTKKNPLMTDARDATIILVDIDPIPVATDWAGPGTPYTR